MPMIPQAVIAMLACARLGAIHSVVFGGFACMQFFAATNSLNHLIAQQLATRITHARPKVILSATGGIEPKKGVIEYKPLLDEAIEIAEHKPSKVVVSIVN